MNPIEVLQNKIVEVEQGKKDCKFCDEQICSCNYEVYLLEQAINTLQKEEVIKPKGKTHIIPGETMFKVLSEEQTNNILEIEKEMKDLEPGNNCTCRDMCFGCSESYEELKNKLKQIK